MKDKVKRAHGDINWRYILRNRELFRRLLTRYVARIAPLAQKLDFKKAQFLSSSYTDSAIRPLTGDILWSVPTKTGSACYIYFLIEHQERSPHLMAARIFRYLGGVYGVIFEQERFSKGKEPLPLVIPIVLYCGEKEWNAPARFADLFSLPEGFPICFDSTYILLDVKKLSVRRLRRLRDALAGLFLLEIGRIKGDREEILQGLGRIMEEKNDNIFEAAYAVWYNTVYGRRLGPRLLEKAQAWRNKRRKEPKMALDMKQLALEWGVAEGIQKGRREGLRKGLRKGIEKGIEKGVEKARKEDLRKALSALKKVLRNKKIDPRDYEEKLKKIKDPGKIVELAADVASAKNPAAYMKRRFGR